MTHGIPVQTFTVAGVVIRKDGKYLLVQEKQPKAYKLWNWPAGKVDEGYSIEQTAVKEAKEESGFDVRLVRRLAIWQETAQEPVQHVFEANIVGGELIFPKDEILDARWFSFQELQSMKDALRGEWILKAAALLEKQKQLCSQPQGARSVAPVILSRTSALRIRSMQSAPVEEKKTSA